MMVVIAIAVSGAFVLYALLAYMLSEEKDGAF